jgi:DNA-binding protein H-NS
MTKETTMQGRIGKVQRLLARLNGNREELQHLEPSRVRFEALLNQVQEAADRQAVHTAAKQEASQQLQTVLVEAERLATVLQLAVKQHYGIRSEKLADFGLKPFRGRQRKGSPEPEPPAPTPEPTPTSSIETHRS